MAWFSKAENPYAPVIEVYEKLVATLRAEAGDREERHRKEREELLQRIMVLTAPEKLRTANSVRQYMGTVSSRPPSFGGAGLPEEFEGILEGADDPAVMPDKRSRIQMVATATAVEVARRRAAAEAARKRATPEPPAEAAQAAQPA